MKSLHARATCLKFDTATKRNYSRDDMTQLRKGLLALTVFLCFAIGILLFAVIATGNVRLVAPMADSMTPTLSKRDHLIKARFTLHILEPARGQVVVFKTDGLPAFWGKKEQHIYRIIGLPGDHIQVTADGISVNGSRIRTVTQASFFTPFGNFLETTVPKDSFYLLGDNPAHSYDSRWWGCVPSQNLVGRILFRYSASGRFGPV